MPNFVILLFGAKQKVYSKLMRAFPLGTDACLLWNQDWWEQSLHLTNTVAGLEEKQACILSFGEVRSKEPTAHLEIGQFKNIGQ